VSLRLRLGLAITKGGMFVAKLPQLFNLLSTQSGDTIITQDELNILVSLDTDT
jgi:hypothetical protein